MLNPAMRPLSPRSEDLCRANNTVQPTATKPTTMPVDRTVSNPSAYRAPTTTARQSVLPGPVLLQQCLSRRAIA
jgi:hypothetical protein